MTNENDFSGGHDAWQGRVFAAATHFRVHRYGRGGHDSMQARTFAEAKAAAEGALRCGFRVLLYCITASGRSTLLPRDSWSKLDRPM